MSFYPRRNDNVDDLPIFKNRRPPARSTDPETSRNAAKWLVDTGAIKEQSRAVYACVVEAPNGVTTQEAAIIMGLPRENISSRFSELKKLGFIEDSGERRKATSRPAIVWKAATRTNEGSQS